MSYEFDKDSTTTIQLEEVVKYERLLSVPEAAKLAALSRSHFYRMVRSGQISCIRIGKAIRIRPEAIGLLAQKEEPIPLPPPQPKKVDEKLSEETFLDRLKPELENAFRDIPSFGEVGIRVVVHDSRVVRVEYTTSVMKKIDPRS